MRACMEGPADGAGAGALPGLTSRSFFRRSVKLAWRAEKFYVCVTSVSRGDRRKGKRSARLVWYPSGPCSCLEARPHFVLFV